MIKVRSSHFIFISEALFATALLVTLGLAWQQLSRMSQRVNEARHNLENIPQELLRQEGLASDLKKQDVRLQELEKLLPSREAIGDVVAVIENVAQKNGVKVIVPDVKEEIRYGRDNKPIAQTGRYQDVRLVIQGYGDPHRLLAFLYEVEHLPYVLKVPAWEVTTDYRVVPAALTVSAPPDTLLPEQPAGLLEANVILTITRNPV